jgi:hypothetical protein
MSIRPVPAKVLSTRRTPCGDRSGSADQVNNGRGTRGPGPSGIRPWKDRGIRRLIRPRERGVRIAERAAD